MTSFPVRVLGAKTNVHRLASRPVSRVLILGGTGVVGRAIASRFARLGWGVDVTGRDPAHMPPELAELGVSFIRADSRDATAMAAACGAGADLLVDCICFTAADARRLLPLVEHVTSTVMISSKAVYVDGVGNHSNSDSPPRFDRPIPESQPTLPPREDIPFDSREGYGVNKVAAERVLLESGRPVSVLRPSKVHGRGARPAREWMWVKRALDRRERVFLAHRGEGGDHTSAAANIAALVETCARHPGARVLNSADPDAPNGVEIARTIAARFDLEWEETLLDGPPVGNVGRHAWDRYPPVVLDTAAALQLGYSPAGDYATTVAAEVDWLVEAAATGLDPADDPFFAGLLDYAAEDTFVAGG